MDVSSKYFTLLRTPGPDLIKHIWYFWRDIRRVGKVRELISFILWEIRHRLYLYQFSNRYIQFTDHAGLLITHEGTVSANHIITTPFLREQGLCFRAVAIDWKFCLQTTDGCWWGSRYSQPNTLFCSHDNSQSALPVHEFPHSITSLFISRQNVLFICTNGTLYKCDHQGHVFKPVLRFSSAISYFLYNNGMTELPDGTLAIGEYGSIWHGDKWQNLAYLYHSVDGGETWQTSDFLIRHGVNKHIHVVKYSPLLKALLLTDGDNKKQLWMNTNLTDFSAKTGRSKTGWRLLTRFHHQTGGYLSMAETGETVLFGSDYLGGTNFIVDTTDGKQFRKLVLPDPYRRSPVMNMVARQSSAGTEIWATTYSCLSDNTRSLLMCTQDAGKTWTRVLDFDGRKNEIRMLNSSHHPTQDLFLSITEFTDDPANPRHRVYRLTPQ